MVQVDRAGLIVVGKVVTIVVVVNGTEVLVTIVGVGVVGIVAVAPPLGTVILVVVVLNKHQKQEEQ